MIHVENEVSLPRGPSGAFGTPQFYSPGMQTRVNKRKADSHHKRPMEILKTWQSLDSQQKNYLLPLLLQNSPLQTIQRISSIVLGIKQDFVSILPVEISHQIIMHLDVRSLCRCSQVSQLWKSLLSGPAADVIIWKPRIINEGFATADLLSTMVDSPLDSLNFGSPMKIDSNIDLDDHSFVTVHNDPMLSPGEPFLPKLSCNTLLNESLIDEIKDEVINRNSVITPCESHDEFPLSRNSAFFRDFYKRSHIIRSNWLVGRYRRISFPGHGSSVVTCLQFDTEKIVSGSDDHTIHIYNTNEGELEKRLLGHEGGVWALQFLGQTLVSGSTDRTVRVWDMESGECTHLFDGHTSTVRCLLIIEQGPGMDSPLIVTGSRDTTLRVWKLPDVKRDAPWKPSLATRPPLPLALSEAEKLRNPFFQHILNGHTNSVRAIAGEANVLISGSYDCTVRSWDLKTGQNVFIFRGHREKVYSVGYSHALNRAASGSLDSTVRVWCTKTGMPLFCLDGHTSLVGLLELSSKFLVSAAADATLRVWDPNNGQCLASLVGHNAAITCFHHDPNMNRIVSGSDGGIKIWELDSLGYGTKSLVCPSVIPFASPLANKLAISQTPNGTTPMYGRFVTDVLSTIQGVWRVRMDETRLVCATQRDTGQGQNTWFEILDFSDHPDIGTHVSKPGDGSNSLEDEEEDEEEDDDDVLEFEDGDEDI